MSYYDLVCQRCEYYHILKGTADAPIICPECGGKLNAHYSNAGL